MATPPSRQAGTRARDVIMDTSEAGATTRRLVLASQSSRRRTMLEDAKVRFSVMLPTLEDSELVPGQVDAQAWAASLAYVKALSVWHALRGAAHPRKGVTILGADTIVVHRGAFLGKAKTPEHAQTMLAAMLGDEHEVVTGVAILDAETGDRELFADTAHIRMGAVEASELRSYIASGNWRGKAGAYNLSEQLAAGWKIDCTGDPTTVMGLPMRKLAVHLTRFQS